MCLLLKTTKGRVATLKTTAYLCVSEANNILAVPQSTYWKHKSFFFCAKEGQSKGEAGGVGIVWLGEGMDEEFYSH